MATALVAARYYGSFLVRHADEGFRHYNGVVQVMGSSPAEVPLEEVTVAVGRWLQRPPECVRVLLWSRLH